MLAGYAESTGCGCALPDQVTQRLEPGLLYVALHVASTLDGPNNCPQPAAVFTALPPGHFHQPRVVALQWPEYFRGPLRPTSGRMDTSLPLGSSPSSHLCPRGPGPLPTPPPATKQQEEADHFPPSWEPQIPIRPPGPGEADRGRQGINAAIRVSPGQSSFTGN